MGLFKKKPTLTDQLAEANAKLAQAERQIAALKIEVEAGNHQLHFWHEQSRTLENQARIAQQLYFGSLDAMRRIREAPEAFESSLQTARAAMAAQPPIESLIMAVALASSSDVKAIGRLFPEVADKLPGPVKPPPQIISDASGERTALRG